MSEPHNKVYRYQIEATLDRLRFKIVPIHTKPVSDSIFMLRSEPMLFVTQKGLISNYHLTFAKYNKLCLLSKTKNSFDSRGYSEFADYLTDKLEQWIQAGYDDESIIRLAISAQVEWRLNEYYRRASYRDDTWMRILQTRYKFSFQSLAKP